MTDFTDNDLSGLKPGAERRAEQELTRDRRVERMLLWKGVLALTMVLVIAYLRQRYFL